MQRRAVGTWTRIPQIAAIGKLFVHRGKVFPTPGCDRESCSKSPPLAPTLYEQPFCFQQQNTRSRLKDWQAGCDIFIIRGRCDLMAVVVLLFSAFAAGNTTHEKKT